ncbi:MAG: GWxTD domain-containing protein [Bacteroidota bacterium]
MRISLVIALLALCVNPKSQAQAIQVDMDHATFAYDESEALLEVYLAFEAEKLNFQPQGDGFAAMLPFEIAVQRGTTAELAVQEAPVWRDSTSLSFVVPDTSQINPGQYFLHQLRTTVPPGEYEVSLTIPGDPVLGRAEVELKRDVLVADYAQQDQASLSDVTFAGLIEQSEDRESPFYKNGLLVRPNANQLYGLGMPRLFYYLEAYNTESISSDGPYTLFTYLAEANRPQPMEGFQKRTQRQPRSTDVIVGSFNIGALPSGSYFLRVVMLNASNESVVEQSRKFFVFNPQVQREQVASAETSFESSVYAAMPQDRVDAQFEYIEYIASAPERKRLKGIRDLDEKRRFLMNFWSLRDPNPNTPVNEFEEEYLQRVQFANERYTQQGRAGWKSDRGRVMLTYGMPTDMQSRLYNRGTLPHEVWTYNNIPGEGQSIFVFIDEDGFGRFDLIHSSVTGEIQEFNWQNRVRRQ